MRIRIALCFVFSVYTALACINDADTERNIQSPPNLRLAEIIRHTDEAPVAENTYRERIKALKAEPHEEDPVWWNNLAGAYLRLGEPQAAVNLLEPLLEKFPKDYGVHANLGTAYHLLGRFEEAEKEIARDLELNPDGHSGLEKYHLALLQYLIRDREYQKENLYVYEWTKPFRDKLPDQLGSLSAHVAFKAPPLDGVAEMASRPAYLQRFSLAMEPTFEEGVLYMASLNRKEPACFVMLGIVCCLKRDFELAVTAWEKAIALKSPQAELLQTKIQAAKAFIESSRRQSDARRALRQKATLVTTSVLILVVIACGAAVLFFVRRYRQRGA